MLLISSITTVLVTICCVYILYLLIKRLKLENDIGSWLLIITVFTIMLATIIEFVYSM